MKVLTDPLTDAFPRRRRFLLFSVAYIALWMTTWHSASLVDVLGSASLWYLPAGLRFCCLLLLGWPGLLLELCTNLLVSFTNFALSDQKFPDAFSAQMFWLIYAWFSSSLACAIVVMPLRQRMKDRWDLTRPNHSFLFLAAALAASALSALAGTFHLASTGIITAAQQAEVVTSWLIGDFIGIITLAPLLLVRVWPRLHLYLRQGQWTSSLNSVALAARKRRVADARIALVALVSLLLVFAIPKSLASGGNLPLFALLLLLPQIVVALRYNLRGALLAVFLLDSGLVVLVASLHQGESALQYQLVMVAIALVGLWLGGAIDSRNRHMDRNQDFASVSNDLLWETDGKGVLVSLEGRLARHFSLSPGQSWRALLERVEPSHLKLLEQALARRQPFRHMEVAILSSTRVPRWIHINGLPVRDESGELTGYRGTATDITRAHRAKALLDNYTQELVAEVAQQTRALQQTNNELVVKEQRLQVILAAVPVGVLELDSADRCRYLNVNGGKLTGCDPELAKGRFLMEFVHPDDHARLQEAWRGNRQSQDVQWLEFRLGQSNLWCTAYWAHLQQADHTVDGTIMVLTDSTARRQQDERLWALAHHDPLTDLPNRNLFWDRCLQAMSLAKRRNRGAALLWLDLDGFKSVNDQLGHAAGDALLQQVAQRLKGRIRDSDTVARMGGDEFAVIMPDVTDPDTALLVANELAASLNDVFHLPQGSIHISGSVGIALYPRHAITLETLTQYADMAMYSAKHAGKNQVKVWSQDCHAERPSSRAEVWAESRQ
jgi:diguanylate cyclase (GGDEF)-like protein/PAS domain S-box-containing protein